MTPYYEESGIIIYHDDCRTFLPDAKAKVSAVVSDPPYGIDLTNHGMMGSNGWSRVYGDEDTTAGEDCLDWAKDHSVPTVVFASPWDPWPGVWRNLIVWDKGEAVGGGGDTVICLKRTWELIQVARNTVPVVPRCGSVWSYPINQSSLSYHPTQKPEALMCRLVSTFTGISDVILDPFMGSGTTLVAAKRLGRKAIGVEIEECYCEIAAKRLSQGVLPLSA